MGMFVDLVSIIITFYTVMVGMGLLTLLTTSEKPEHMTRLESIYYVLILMTPIGFTLVAFVVMTYTLDNILVSHLEEKYA